MIYNLERLKNKMQENNIDILIASTKENILYFSGFKTVIKTLNPYHGECYIVITKGQENIINVIHSVGEVDQILDSKTEVGLVETYGLFYREYNNIIELNEREKKLKSLSKNSNSYDTPSSALIALIRKLDVECDQALNIGYDEDGMSDIVLNSMMKEFDNIIFTKSSFLIRKIRQVKTAYEIDMLSRAAKCNEKAILETMKKVKEGYSEKKIANIFDQELIKQGARPALTMIKVGREAVGGQQEQKDDIFLKTGDIIWFDSDSEYEGFWADIARTYVFKQDNLYVHKIYETLQLGMTLAKENIKAGMKASDVFNLVLEEINSVGVFQYNRHHVGHGIGLEPYEKPILSPNDDTIIENGMVISIETPYYEFGIGAVHIEDPILVRETGNIFLTEYGNPNFEVWDAKL